ncbi:MAG: nuclear transport factor 2 family protein [Acidobacteria bacterium]|nr:nuclear transport factor 2 family protein [Acidobacteriota bacterium]MCA1650840.1 nuclear transport factor 2 family protein [Acidobacteriota bacterium]
MRARTVTGAALVALLALTTAWLFWPPNTDRQIRRRLTALADEFNSNTADALGTATKAVRIGDYFTEDVVIDLGQGSSTIVGRETLVGMAARLQPRTGPFTLRLDDITVDAAGDGRTATVALTLTITGTSSVTGPQSIDAREFSLGMHQSDGEWRIARVAPVDTIK